MADQQSSYAMRINRVLDHIDAHLAEKLDLASLARVAYVSEWHFHRVFLALTGETPGQWVRRRRLEVAATRLLGRRREPVLKVALEVGFKSPEVFTRAFVAQFGVTPSAWRRGAAARWAAQRRLELSKIRQADRKANQDASRAWLHYQVAWPRPVAPLSEARPMPVEIKSLPETRVAYLRYVGPYGTSGITHCWQRFSAWCAAHGLLQPPRVRFGVSRDNPQLTAADRLRYDACVAVDAAFEPDPADGIGIQTIQAGRYACTPFIGTANEINGAWMSLFSTWLPATVYEVDDRSAIERYGEASGLDTATGAFSCELCLPIRF